MPSDFRLLTHADVNRLSEIRRFIQDSAEALDVAPAIGMKVSLAVDEAVTNIAAYGYGGTAGKLEIRVKREGDLLTVQLRDEAAAFDPTQVDSPNLELPLEERPLGGMGLYFIRKMTDEVRYRSLAPKGNELTLVKHCESSPERITASMQMKEEARSGITLLRLEGQVDDTALADLRDRLQDLVAAGRQRVIIDLAGVPSLTPGGLTVLQTAMRTARSGGGEVRLAGMHGETLQLFNQSGMGTMYRVFGNVAEAEQDFKMDISEREEGKVTVVTPVGDLDAASAPGLESRLRTLLKENQSRLVLDFSETPYIASAGFRVLQSILLASRASGGGLRIANVRPEVKEVFELSGFDQIFQLFGSTAKAVESFNA